MRLAVLTLLGRADEAETVRREPVTIRQIENYTDAWAFLVPEPARERARLAHALAGRYTLVRENLANVRELLGLDAPEVMAAYEAEYNTPLETIYNLNAAPYTPDVNDALLQRARWHRVGRGDIVVQQGATADRLYILVDGAMQAIRERGEPQRPLPAVLRVHPGEMIGDVALWTDEPYSRTVVALRDSSLVSLAQADFDVLTAEYPAILRTVAARTVERLRQIIAPRPTIPTTETITLLPASPLPRAFTEALVDDFAAFGRALYLSPPDVQAQLDDYGTLTVDDYAATPDFRDWLEQQHADYRYIILEADAAHPVWTQRISEQANRIAIVGLPQDLRARCAAEDIYAGIPQPELSVERHLVVVHEKRATAPRGTAALLACRTVNNHHHVALDHPPDLTRLVRHLRGKPIGIVFGGGGMRGTAHLGVLRAMHELGIPIDHVGGTSAGAIVAAQAALEWDVNRMLETTKARVLKKNAVMQLTLPLVSLSGGHVLNRAYEDMFGGYRMEDLWRPAFTIASNLTQARMEIMDRGSLHRAVRASSSLAGVHPPTIAENNDLLIDGGGFDNTPADVMRVKLQSGIVLAVDLGFTKRTFPNYNYGDSLSGWRVLWNRINPLRDDKLEVPLISTIMMRANALWSIQATPLQVAQADLVLHPPVSEYGLFELEAADDLYQAGYEDALAVLTDWLASGALADTLAARS
jgi:NTE family protein